MFEYADKNLNYWDLTILIKDENFGYCSAFVRNIVDVYVYVMS